MTLSTQTAPTADILIVDDTPDNLRLLSTMLLENGYKVRKAINGERALQAVEAVPPDLILLDIMMPGMNGYEVCGQLKASEKTQRIPVIFVSALDDAFDKVLAFDVGGADYISKPFRVQEVLARVQHQLIIRHQEQQLLRQNKQLRLRNAELKKLEANLDAYIQVVTYEVRPTIADLSDGLQQLMDQPDQDLKAAAVLEEMDQVLARQMGLLDDLVEGNQAEIEQIRNP
ncbi:response regulator [Leptolyngbya sp. Heron Island J]|uniref:response regulator n=1 Tax=Leptolyngbya sp. Heron Island J TaxID=1385935 RepID=UPI00040040B8|nr:response regulator [Leptolyngbya sp. Heron Island J]